MAVAAVSLRAADIASQLPEKPARYVTDRAGVLGPGGPEALNEKLAQFARDTSNAIVVWIDGRVPEGFTLGDHGRAARSGARAKDGQRRVLFVFRKGRSASGFGLEGAIPDAIARRIIDGIVRGSPGDFAGGVTAGAEALMAAKGDTGDRPDERRSTAAGKWPLAAVDHHLRHLLRDPVVHAPGRACRRVGLVVGQGSFDDLRRRGGNGGGGGFSGSGGGSRAAAAASGAAAPGSW
jgi:uncharacterized protein